MCGRCPETQRKCIEFGFFVEGTLARYPYRAGEYVEVHMMARFKPE